MCLFTEVPCSEADVARSLLFTISNDIGQIACLYAMMHNLNKVCFKFHNINVDFKFKKPTICKFNFAVQGLCVTKYKLSGCNKVLILYSKKLKKYDNKKTCNTSEKH